jgi:3-mercaptopyruvate sulfurtransferase SseA
MDRGFKKVRPLAGGLDAWVAAGYETHGVAGDARESTLPVRTVG